MGCLRARGSGCGNSAALAAPGAAVITIRNRPNRWKAEEAGTFRFITFQFGLLTVISDLLSKSFAGFGTVRRGLAKDQGCIEFAETARTGPGGQSCPALSAQRRCLAFQSGPNTGKPP